MSDPLDDGDATNAARSHPGRTERALDLLRRVLRRRVSVAALMELAAWLAVPYLLLGFGWQISHPDETLRIQARLQPVLPVGADVVGFGLTVVLWPASVEIANTCPAR